MTSNGAIKGLLGVILGCCLANIALVIRMDIKNMVKSDMAEVKAKLAVLEQNQKVIVTRQAVAMKALKIEPLPEVQP